MKKKLALIVPTGLVALAVDQFLYRQTESVALLFLTIHLRFLLVLASFAFAYGFTKTILQKLNYLEE